MMQKFYKIAFKAAKCIAYVLVALALYVPAVLVLAIYLPFIAIREAASTGRIRQAIRHGGHRHSHRRSHMVKSRRNQVPDAPANLNITSEAR